MMKIINAEKYFIGTEVACAPSLYFKKAPKTEREQARRPQCPAWPRPLAQGSGMKRCFPTPLCLGRHLCTVRLFNQILMIATENEAQTSKYHGPQGRKMDVGGCVQRQTLLTSVSPPETRSTKRAKSFRVGSGSPGAGRRELRSLFC